MLIVKRKGNRRTVKGKNNRRSRSPSKRPISRTQDKQSDISEPVNGLRRSSRFRVPPLDIWRNERLVFQTLPSGDVKCSIDKGSEEDKYGLIQITKKAERRAQMKKKKALTVENTPILDTRTGETVKALLHRPFESLQWLMMGPNEVERPSPYTLVKAFESNSTSFGFLKFSPFAIKEMHYAPLHNLHFVLMKGAPGSSNPEYYFQFYGRGQLDSSPGCPLFDQKLFESESIALLYGFQKPLLPASVRRITQLRTGDKYSRFKNIIMY
ncbi:CENP-C_C domain-containing protein [Trichonephila clavipes]|nr:CENP-C_C domain-containing protein [Trichonephila clavipes]